MPKPQHPKEHKTTMIRKNTKTMTIKRAKAYRT
jgi:hypothetical protein